MEKPVNALLLKKTERYTFKTHESYSPEEVIAAGGTTAFAIKKGKTFENMLAKIKDAPEAEFTDEEWDIIQEQLKNDK